tara:strand:+ start:336 stop:509 length:174 start_codon:yes stop_codon:yes gene_type:complete
MVGERALGWRSRGMSFVDAILTAKCLSPLTDITRVSFASIVYSAELRRLSLGVATEP